MSYRNVIDVLDEASLENRLLVQPSRFRMIAGMADAGFLLSPTTATARDFAALRSSEAGQSSNTRVRSFVIRQESARPLWGTTFDVQLSALHVPVDVRLDDILLGRLRDGPAVAGLPVGGDCAIEAVGRTGTSDQPVSVDGGKVTVSGWGVASTPGSGPEPTLWVTLTPERGGGSRYAVATRTRRPDVDAYFERLQPTYAGFEAAVDLDRLSGSYRLAVVQDAPGGPLLCTSTQVTIIKHLSDATMPKLH